MFLVSFAPSLLPRRWLEQGVIGGIVAAIGYLIGFLLELTADAIGRLLGLNVQVSWTMPGGYGVLAVLGAILLALFKRWLDRNPNRFNFALLKSAVESTAKLSAFVVFILVGARIFSLTFYGVNGHVWVEHLWTSLPGGQVGFLVFVNIMVFLLAFFLDFFELAFIVIPLLGPVAEKLGIDLIWFGVIMTILMEMGLIHPPVGLNLFVISGIAPDIKLKEIMWGTVPFLLLMALGIILLCIFPAIATWLPSQYSGS